MAWLENTIRLFLSIIEFLIDEIKHLAFIVSNSVKFLTDFPNFWQWLPDEFAFIICMIVSTALIVRTLGWD